MSPPTLRLGSNTLLYILRDWWVQRRGLSFSHHTCKEKCTRSGLQVFHMWWWKIDSWMDFWTIFPFNFWSEPFPQTLPDMVSVIPSITALGPSTEPSILVDWISPGAVLGSLRIAWGHFTNVGWGSSSGCETHSRDSRVCSWSCTPAWCLEYRLYICSRRMECSADGV